MRIQLSQLEARLQSLIEGSAARLFPAGGRGGGPYQELGARLVQAMRANIHPQADGSMWAPNVYLLLLPPARAREMQANPAILDELARLLHQAGEEAGLRFPSPPVIKIVEDSSIAPKQGHIQAQYHLEHLVETYIMDSGAKEEAAQADEKAFLIVNGTQVYPLDGSMVSLGRSQENQIVLDDPRVSRVHAQLRLVNGRYHVFDLDSTGGTFVNAQSIKQSPLYPGDVISLAGIPVIFGQEQAGFPDDTQEMPPFMPWPGEKK